MSSTIKLRLDEKMVIDGLVQSRSQAANLIKLGKVIVDGKPAHKPGQKVDRNLAVNIINEEKYVSRAGFKLAGANAKFAIDFRGKTVLDVGSSTGGFTDYVLQKGAERVIAVDVGTNQLHPSLRDNERIELHEKTDIREFKTERRIDVIVVDVSFISLRSVLPRLKRFMYSQTIVIAMLKPQFEAGDALKHKGVIKNSKMRRQIIKDFELWLKQHFVVIDSKDSDITGAKGNTEKFYLLKKQ